MNKREKLKSLIKSDPLFHQLVILTNLAMNITGITISYVFYKWLFDSPSVYITTNVILFQVIICIVINIITIKRFNKTKK